MTTRPLGPAVAELGESPFWSPEENCIWWVDVTGRQVLRTDIDTGATLQWPTPEEIGFIARVNGGLVVGMERGLCRFDPSAGSFDLITGTELAPGMRFNDATVDAGGRLWASTMRVANDRAEGAIHLFLPDRSMHRLAEGFRTPNGLAFDTARSRLYFSDSHPTVRRVWHATYDPAGEQIEGRELFMEFANGDGRPDGACIDAGGTYWIACLEAGTIQVLGCGAAVRRTICLDPPVIVTKPTFGPGRKVIVTAKGLPGQARAGLSFFEVA